MGPLRHKAALIIRIAVPASTQMSFLPVSHSLELLYIEHDGDFGFAALIIEKKEEIVFAEDDVVANKIHKKGKPVALGLKAEAS